MTNNPRQLETVPGNKQKKVFWTTTTKPNNSTHCVSFVDLLQRSNTSIPQGVGTNLTCSRCQETINIIRRAQPK
ncbi:hypothetical protein Hanom_Chr05g00427471 [Helianthus anomalus]